MRVLFEPSIKGSIWPRVWLAVVLGLLLSMLNLQWAEAQEGGLLVYPFYGPWRTPSQAFWSRHQALDFYMPDYEPLVADATGVIDLVDWWNDDCHQYYGSGDPYACGFGLHLRINHGEYRTWYAHLSTTAFDLGVANRTVYQGQVLGSAGHNGYSSAPHLHFQFQELVNGTWYSRDPRNHWVDQPVTPRPITGGAYLVDEPNPAFSRTGTWIYENDGYGGSMRWTYVKDNPMNTATWRPDLSDAGVYEVWVYVPDVRATSWQARYEITHAAGTAYARVDQQGLYNRWVSIGVYYFPAGANREVYVEDDTGEGYRTHCYDAVGISPTGQYRCVLGVDAVKFVQQKLPMNYLPDLRVRDGWESTFYIQNGADTPQLIWLTVFDEDGRASCGGAPFSLPPYSMATAFVNSCGPTTRAGIVSGGEKISVAVSQRRSNPDAAASYTAVHQPQSSIYVPLLMKNNYGLDSRIYLQNIGTSATTPVIRFRPAPGYSGYAATYVVSSSIPPKGQMVVDLDDIGVVGSQFVGSAQINAGQPLAVTWTQRLGHNLLQESGASGGVAPTVYAPLVQNDNWGIISGMAMQNASSQNDQTLALTYRRSADGAACARRTRELDRRYAAVYPNPPYQGNPGDRCSPVLSAVITGEGSNTAGMVSQVLPGSMVATDYPVIAHPGTEIGLPILWKAWGDQSSGFVVQNTSGRPTAVTVSFYDSLGNRVCAEDYSLVELGVSQVVYPLPGCVAGGFYGSAVLTADREVAVVVNHLFGSSGDNSLSHIGVHRQ